MTRRLIPLLALGVLLGACGNSTPDTEGKTLQEARQQLIDFGVPARNISVRGLQGEADPAGDPSQLIVCDHDPDGVEKTTPTTLTVATECPAGTGEEEGGDKKKRKKRRR